MKSTSGEELASVAVEPRGLAHDRAWAAYTADGGIASGKTTRRFRRVDGLLAWRSAQPPDASSPLLVSPGGERYRVDDPAASRALATALGHSLKLRREAAVRHHDECAVHVVTTCALREIERLVGGPVDHRRLRANIVLETAGTGFLEDAWSGALLHLGGEVVLRLGAGMPRCVMVDLPQAGVQDGPPVLRALGRRHDTLLGVQADVVRGGTVAVGHVARLVIPVEP